MFHATADIVRTVCLSVRRVLVLCNYRVRGSTDRYSCICRVEDGYQSEPQVGTLQNGAEFGYYKVKVQQVRFVSVKAERPNHRGGGQPARGEVGWWRSSTTTRT